MKEVPVWEKCTVGGPGMTNGTRQGVTPALKEVRGTLRTHLSGLFLGFSGGFSFFPMGLFSSFSGSAGRRILGLPHHGAFFWGKNIHRNGPKK